MNSNRACVSGPALRRARQRISAAWWLPALCLLAIAADSRAGDFQYTTNGSTVTVVGYTGAGGDLTIPGTNSDGLAVTGIGARAFDHRTDLSAVTIPNSVTNIGDWAFSYCAKLSSVTVPDSVIAIGGGAFHSCIRLSSVTIANSVTGISDKAFDSCTNLDAIYFLGSAPALGEDVFANDPATTIFYLPDTTGWGATYGGRPAVCWNPRVARFDAHTNGFGFTIEGSTNITVVVRASTNLLDQAWSSLTTTTLTNGTAAFMDADCTNCAGRFYRFSIP